MLGPLPPLGIINRHKNSNAPHIQSMDIQKWKAGIIEANQLVQETQPLMHDTLKIELLSSQL